MSWIIIWGSKEREMRWMGVLYGVFDEMDGYGQSYGCDTGLERCSECRSEYVECMVKGAGLVVLAVE